MTDALDFAKTAAQWVDEFGNEAPGKARRKAEMLSRAGDDTGSKWHETIAQVAEYLLDEAPAREALSRL